MANWKKILFEGADIHVTSITASNLPTTSSNDSTLKVLTIDPSGKIRFRQQGQLNQQVGDITGSISGSDGTSFDNFDFSAHTLNFSVSNQNIFEISASGQTNATTVNFRPLVGYVTSSGDLNIISASSLNPNIALTDASGFGLFGLGIGGLGAGLAPNALLNSLGGDYSTTILPLLQRHNTNAENILNNTRQIDPDATTIQQGFPSNEDLSSWRTLSNLWLNRHSTLPEGTANLNQLDSNASTVGQHSIYWLSASLVGGFPDGTPSLSASFFTSPGGFSSSIDTLTGSIGTLLLSQSQFNTATGSMLQDQFTSSFALESEFISDTVTSIEAGNIDVDQVGFVNTDELGNTLNQGKRIRLGTPTNDSDIQAFDNTLRDLTIGGTFTADEFDLPEFGFEEIQISRIGGGVTFGTSSLHTHKYLGHSFVTGGGVEVTGSFKIDDAPAVENSVVTMLVVGQDGVSIKKQTVGFDAINPLLSSMASSSQGVSQSFATRINTIQGQITTDGNEITLIGHLTASYNTLTGSYNRGILFATASNLSNAQSNNIVGSKIGLKNTASFETSQLTSQTGLTNKILTASFNAARTEIKYHLNTRSFADVTGIYTGSGTVNTADIISDVNSLDRYGKRSDLILTQSNTVANRDYIAELAKSGNGPGPNLGGSDANTRFLTGSGDFSDLSYPDGTFVNDANDSTTQGVIKFGLDPDGDGSGVSVIKFGATGSEMGINGNPSFAGLTLSGQLTVNGTLTQIQTTNLNVKDQFILVNDGATVGTAGDGGGTSDNDKDGGILVDAGGGSGSLFMYDFSARAWGIRGAGTTNHTSFDASSELAQGAEGPVVPDTYVRTIIYDAGFPPPQSASLYGSTTGNTNLGQMYVDTTTDTENVYIYA